MFFKFNPPLLLSPPRIRFVCFFFLPIPPPHQSSTWFSSLFLVASTLLPFCFLFARQPSLFSPRVWTEFRLSIFFFLQPRFLTFLRDMSFNRWAICLLLFPSRLVLLFAHALPPKFLRRSLPSPLLFPNRTPATAFEMFAFSTFYLFFSHPSSPRRLGSRNRLTHFSWRSLSPTL